MLHLSWLPHSPTYRANGLQELATISNGLAQNGSYTLHFATFTSGSAPSGNFALNADTSALEDCETVASRTESTTNALDVIFSVDRSNCVRSSFHCNAFDLVVPNGWYSIHRLPRNLNL